MLKLLMQKLIRYLRENAVCCTVCAASLAGGIAIGAVLAASMPELDTKELSLYFADFFEGFAQTGADTSIIFADALRLQGLLFVLLFLCSGMIFGSPLIAAIGIALGASGGFAAAFLLKIYGIRALLFLLCAMLPHTLLLLPCHFAALCVCLRFSVLLWQGRIRLKSGLRSHILVLCALFAVAFAAILLQSYVEPLLVDLTAQYFVA